MAESDADTTMAADATATGGGPDAASSSPNAHVVAFLEQFFSLDHAPGYAVLLTGRWGAGKSHLVSSIVTGCASAGRRILPVSMYGLSNRREIDEAITLARFPWIVEGLGGRRPRVGEVVGAVAELAEPGPPFRPPMADGYVFDDVERSSMQLSDVLGYINRLVERDGRKVVVVADEVRLQGRHDGDAFRLSKEKVIGRTLTVRPDFDAAFASFVAELKSPAARDLLLRHQDEVRGVYEQSGTGNLRLLRQTLWDYERVAAALEERHKANVGAMSALIRLLFSMSFEFKSGGIDPEDVAGRSNRLYSGIFNSNKEPGKLRLAAGKYGSLTMSDSILPDDVLGAILVDGLINATDVRRALDRSSWFPSGDEPAWMTVWHAIDRDDGKVAAAVEELMQQFERREFVATGEILHVFGLVLNLAAMDAIGWTLQEAAAQCRAYVDDMRATGRLEPPKLAILDDERHGSYAGLGFAGREHAQFNETWEYLNSERAAGERDRFAAQAGELLELMDGDATEFVRRIGGTGDSMAPFARLPVFAKLDPETFAEAVFRLPPDRLREVMIGLSGRYDLGKLDRELQEERPWITEVRAALLRLASAAPIWTRNRVEKVVRWTFDDRLGPVPSGGVQEGVDRGDGPADA